MKISFRCFNGLSDVVRLTVMLYIRYPLSLREAEEILFERGIDICHEAVRRSWKRFGRMFAAEIRGRQVRPQCYSLWRWHVDEAFVQVNVDRLYLLRPTGS